ncbi:MAG: tyrosine-type recombinase/integrase, partial [Silvibacterium sp.]
LMDTKNGSSREVHLNSMALAALQGIKTGRKATDAVFPSTMADHSQKAWFPLALEAAKIMGYTWHGNRHTFCSWLAMAGASLKDIQELAGHKTIAMSARYAKLATDHKLAAVERISAAPETA